jgi:hypothetical protein
MFLKNEECENLESARTAYLSINEQYIKIQEELLEEITNDQKNLQF